MSSRKPRGRIGRIFWLLAAVAMIVAALPLAGAAAHTEDAPQVVDLLADGRNDEGLDPVDVGDVEIWNDGEYLYVDYAIDTGLADTWCLTKTQVSVETDSASIPQTKKNNPTPGKFAYTGVHELCETDVSYMIPMTWTVTDVLAIAVHANVEVPGGVDGIPFVLPATVQMSVQYPYAGGPSYFQTTVTGDPLTGIYNGWCIDTQNTIAQNTTYTANVSSSYEAGSPANMDQVNWIINQGFVGTDAGGMLGFYTYGDVQRAIWTLVDPNSTSGLGSWSPLRVAEILAAAAANGVGYEPGCDDVVAIILDPVGAQQVTIAQKTFIELGVPCDTRTETAWAEGYDFGGKQWGMWFEYTVQ
jgi:hypothetical protein